MGILYEYECENCERTFEVVLTLEELETTQPECPHCMSLETHRLCGNHGGFRLSDKGNVGWSKDGYGTHYGDIANFREGRKVYK